MKKHNNLEEQIEKEALCLDAMCGEKDRQYFATFGKNADYKDFARLFCICAVFDFKLAMLRVLGDAEKHNAIDGTINYISSITYDYELLTGWIEEFIDNIASPELKDLALSLWNKKKSRFDKDGFALNKIFHI